MTEAELRALIANGESSRVEFKQAEVSSGHIAREIAALLNFEGGYLLLGVDDDGAPTGLIATAKKIEERIMNVCRTTIDPPIVPHWETVRIDGRHVGVVGLPADSADKPYKARQKGAWRTMLRVGTTTREATREEEARLYYSGGIVRPFVTKPVVNATLADLDMRRLRNYFEEIRRQSIPPIEEGQAWLQLLRNVDFIHFEGEHQYPTVAAVLLFGREPYRYLKMYGINAVAFPGSDKGYSMRETDRIRLPIVPLTDAAGNMLEPGLIEEAMAFVGRNIGKRAGPDVGGRLQERWDVPLPAIREALVNAVAHRDWTIPNDISLFIYSDRLEVLSPGRLPNTITSESMKQGCRAARNELLKDTLRDYGYVEGIGMGVSRIIVRGMREHNGTEPDIIEYEQQLTIRLWK